MISSLVERYLMPRTFRISLTYAIFIIFGLALGPWRGAFLGLLSDTLNQVIFGISTWMIEYAIIPVIISFLSGLLINIIYLKRKNFWLINFTFLLGLTIFLIYFLMKNYSVFRWNEYSTKLNKTKLIPVNIVLSISLTVMLLIWAFTLTLFVIHVKNKRFKVKWTTQLIFGIFITLFVILIICRWLWGPFAYINYHNRFRNGTWKYKDYYLIFMIPIIFKSLIEVPIYTVIIYSFFPVINILRKKIYFYRTQANL